MALYLLHGTLYCTIYGAENLVNEVRLTGGAPPLLRQMIGVVESTVHLGRGPSRLYATVDLDRVRVGRTRVIDDNLLSPVWMESFRIYCAHWASHVVVSIKDDDRVGSHVLGRGRVKVSDLLRGGALEETFLDLYRDDGVLVKGGGRVRVRMEFKGVKADAEGGTEVERTYFDQRQGCDVRLYQDAHMREGFLPNIYLTGGKLRDPTRCWEDVLAAVMAAEVFLYIAGWSVFTEVTLKRDGVAPHGGAVTLGELLKYKAEQGVAVVLLVWDDRTSVGVVRPTGLMGTHDEQTFAFFRGTKVKCLLCPRMPDDSLSVIQGFQLSTMFTHHQKLVCCDFALPHSSASSASPSASSSGHFSASPSASAHYPPSANFSVSPSASAHYPPSPSSSAHFSSSPPPFASPYPSPSNYSSSHHHLPPHFPNFIPPFGPPSHQPSQHFSDSHSRRQVISFVGGIDLCDGRYDDQRHSLFRTLHLEHSDDFYQPCMKGSSRAAGGPREPWHDIHCRILGPAAWDVLRNFEQRWRKQGYDGALVDLDSHPRLLPASTHAWSGESSNSWNVQLFRSIDGAAAFGFPDNPTDAAEMGLVSGKDHVIERSIQDAYIRAIRRAKHFIYIENQYFLGSCHAWESNRDAGCLHLIPLEIVLKIVSKIEADERFVAYILIPMWPEGIPESQQVQAILDWQRKTMEMMYKQISLALHAAGKTAEQPTDYLTFFCLGNREARFTNEEPPTGQIPENSLHYKLAHENRRFMIYVHSKLMIVDDDYIILGSANINQRSMDGGRDTEIAIGAHQPFHSIERGPVHGQVHGFRMSLWYEHLGHLSNTFLEPWSLECVRHVNGAASELWDIFSGGQNEDLPGHLLAYPVAISPEGTVSELPGQPFFPDTKASVLGKMTALPSILTT